MSKKSNIPAAQDGSLINRLLAAFEQARHVDEGGREYWLARKYMDILGYSSWQRFEGVIDRAKAALEHEGGVVADHFNNVVEVITAGKGAQGSRKDIELSRRACYLVGINGDPSKVAAIAAVQQYFVEQTRKQEINEMLAIAGADADRLAARRKLEQTEGELADEVTPRVTRPDVHVDQVKRAGQHALYQMSPEKVREKKGIPADRELADFERPVLVKAMDFATALTTEQLRADKDTKGVQKISKMNADNHKGARNMIMDAGLNPEILEHDGDIRHVEHRAEKQRVKLVSRNNNDTSD